MKMTSLCLGLVLCLGYSVAQAQTQPRDTSKRSSFHVWNEAFQTRHLAVLGVLVNNENLLKPQERTVLLEALRYANQEVSYVVASKRTDAEKTSKIKALQQEVVARFQKALAPRVFDALIAKAAALTPVNLSKWLAGQPFESETEAKLRKTDNLGGNEPIGASEVKRYRLIAYWKITDASDGPLDNTVECFGEVRINNTLQWQIPSQRAESYSRKSDETLEIGFGLGGQKRPYYDANLSWNSSYHLEGFLKDRDKATADETLCSFSIDISPQIAAGRGDRVLTQPGSKAEFHYRLEEVKS